MRSAGCALEVLTPEALSARYPISAGPLFVVADPKGELRYAGGYALRKQAAELHDLAILRAVRERGETTRTRGARALLGQAVREPRPAARA